MTRTDRDPILITGCSTGIGRATASRLAAGGHTVYATARKLDALDGIHGVRRLALDVTDESSMHAAVDQVVAEHGRVGTLINNAGYGVYGPIEEASLEDVRRMYETNVFGLVRMAQLVLPSMRAAGTGLIVNVGSMGGRFTLPVGGFYHSTKYAVESLSDALRQEVSAFGINVTVVEPGPVRSSFADTIATSETYGDTAAGDSPYAPLVRKARNLTNGTYGSKIMSGSSASVANKIAKAVDAKNPRARYLVTPTAYAMVGASTVARGRAWDALIRTQLRG